MKVLKISFYGIWLLALAVFQPTLVQWISVFDITPNLFLIFVICTAVICGKKSGSICGAVFGLTLDFLIGRLIGVNALIFMYVSLLTGVLCERFLNSTGNFAVAIVVFALSVMCGILYYIAYSMVWGDIGFFKALIRVILPEALYTGLISLVVFVPIRKSFGFLLRRDRVRF